MNDTLRFLLIVALLIALRPIVAFVSILLQFTRVTLSPIRLVDAEEPAELDAAASACLAELSGLGFDVIRRQREISDTGARTTLLLRHRDVPAFAGVGLCADMNVGLPVTFYSFDGAGRMLATSNRQAWVDLAPAADVLWSDTFAASLHEQWHSHRERLASFAACAVDDGEAAFHITRWIEGYLERLQSARRVVRIDGRWHYSFLSGLRLAVRYTRLRRRLAARFFASRVPTGTAEQSTERISAWLRETERSKTRLAPRRDIKLAILIGSLVLSVLVWGAVLGWTEGIAIIAIIFCHEMGHAVVMRAFGYRDMSMFFVPFVGAVVTGAPRQLSAWKQALVLFAGPMPGFVAGVVLIFYLGTQPVPLPGALDWRAIAYLAIGINLFNLLPITPLDGGQLVELALFARWPVARFVFFVGSTVALAAFGFWSGSIAAWTLTGILASTLVSQWRLARLQRAWRSDVSPDERIRHLAAAARKIGVRGLAQQIALIRSLTARQEIARPRVWEAIAIVLMLGAVWGATAFVVLAKPAAAFSPARQADARTRAQLADDAASAPADDASDDVQAPPTGDPRQPPR